MAVVAFYISQLLNVCLNTSYTLTFLFSFAGRGVLDFPLHQVAAIVSNAEHFKVWNKFLVVSNVHV